MLWRLAWRNLWRNRKRTILSSLIISMGLIALIFVDGFILGIQTNMVLNATGSFLGDAQIHRKGFRDANETKKFLLNLPELRERLEADSLVADYSVRTVVQGLLSSSSGSQPILLVGIEPESEKPLSLFDEAMHSGEYIQAIDSTEIVVGHKLAERLELELGHRLVFSASSVGTGEMVQDLFRLSGVYKIGMPELEQMIVLAPKKTLDRLIGIENSAHEVALRFSFREPDGRPPRQFVPPVTSPENEYVEWKDLLPSIWAAMESTDISTTIVALVLFFIVGIGIMNTMIMALYDRFFEFGVLKAVGSTPWQVSRLIVYEAIWLGVVSIVLGSLVGYLLMLWAGHQGIDYSGIDFGGITLRDKIYPELRWEQFVKFPIWTMFCTLVATVYPAILVARVLPTEAMRKVQA